MFIYLFVSISKNVILDDSYHFDTPLPLRWCGKSKPIHPSTPSSNTIQVIFGILSDRFGRKWPLIWNLIIVAILELGAGFVQTFQQFLALRSLFGIGMGGIWGLAAATALENLPVELRGIASGFLQEGYAVGYLIAAVINLFLVPEVGASWRALFWTASGISLFAAFIRMLLPESEVFLKAKAIDRERGHTTGHKTKVFLKETKAMLKKHWLLCIYACLLMTGMLFSFFSFFLGTTPGMESRFRTPFHLTTTLPRLQLPLSRFSGTPLISPYHFPIVPEASQINLCRIYTPHT